jgi:hypothetical protein
MFAQPPFTQLVKIGITRDPKNRLLALRSKKFGRDGGFLAISYMLTSAGLIEKALHELFAYRRALGEVEWFSLDCDELNWVCDNTREGWCDIQKNDHICGESVYELIHTFFPRRIDPENPFHEWFGKRVKRLSYV